MKRSAIFLIIFLIGVSVVFAQGFQDPYQLPEQNSVMGGLGMTWIDGQPYTTVTLAPEFAFGKFGIGLYLQLLMDNNNSFKLRKDEYQGGAGILRAINYIRYGQKYDPFYTRIGMLEMASLGNGFLMWNYNNASNYDKRKIGLALDVDLGKAGFESVTNNLGRLELVGGNVYVRPFRFLNPNAPILKNFRLYGTVVRDDHVPSPDNPEDYKKLTAYGVGADLRLIDTQIFKTGVYYDYGKFQDYGHGQGVGINAIIPEFIGIFGLSAKFEKRFIGDQFIPNFFGPLYELKRELPGIVTDGDNAALVNPFIQLQYATKTEGYFGQLAGHIIHKIRLIGSYERLNGIKYSGIVHLEALAPDLIPKFQLRAYYDKLNIESFKDFRTLDINSVATAEVGYRLNRFLILTTTYRWYWIRQDDGSYKPVERIQPGIAFSYQF